MIVSWLRKNCPKSLKNVLRGPYEYGTYVRYKTMERLFPDDKVYACPCCGIRFSHLTDGGFRNYPAIYNSKRYQHMRQDVLCPFCHSLPRHRILATWCDQHMDSLRGKRILYFALENGMNRWFKRNGISVITADLYNPADLKLDMDNIDQADCSWDIVFCNHVLEHVPDFKQALRELRRILKPGGRLICSFPIDSNYATVDEDRTLVHDSSTEADQERIRKFGQIDHLRVFGRDSKQLLEKAGFRVSVVSGDTMPEEICPVVGPADYDSNQLFVCEK